MTITFKAGTEGRENFDTFAPLGLFNLKHKLTESKADNLIDLPEHATRIARMKEKYLELRTGGAATIH